LSLVNPCRNGATIRSRRATARSRPCEGLLSIRRMLPSAAAWGSNDRAVHTSSVEPMSMRGKSLWNTLGKFGSSHGTFESVHSRREIPSSAAKFMSWRISARRRPDASTNVRLGCVHGEDPSCRDRPGSPPVRDLRHGRARSSVPSRKLFDAPHRPHTSRRIERAKALALPARAVTKIALDSGLSENRSSSAAFRKLTRQTPTNIAAASLDARALATRKEEAREMVGVAVWRCRNSFHRIVICDIPVMHENVKRPHHRFSPGQPTGTDRARRGQWSSIRPRN
jgi:AraC-like DNA-binding protein